MTVVVPNPRGDVEPEVPLRPDGTPYREGEVLKQRYLEPDDPLYEEQYALSLIHANDAWDVERGTSDVIIGVIDTGIDYEHPDLRRNIWINAGEDRNANGIVDEADFNGIDDDKNGFVDDIRGWDFTDAPNYPDGGDYLRACTRCQP